LETRIRSSNDVHNFINTSKYPYISIYDGHGFNDVICVYRSHSSLISMFLDTLETLIQKSLNSCPLIVLGHFNLDILGDNNHENNKQQLIYFVNNFELKSQFKKYHNKARSQLDHIWSNVPGDECKLSVSEAYSLDFHKPIYIAFKLPNTILNVCTLRWLIFNKCSTP
jgi:hypothetical protein